MYVQAPRQHQWRRECIGEQAKVSLVLGSKRGAGKLIVSFVKLTKFYVEFVAMFFFKIWKSLPIYIVFI